MIYSVKSYTSKSSGFHSEMEQNTSSNVYQKSLPNLMAAQMLEHTLYNLVGLDSVDHSAGI